MEDSSVLKREAELRKRNDDIKSRRHSIDVISSDQKSAEKVDSVITESEASRRSSNAIKKFEKTIAKHKKKEGAKTEAIEIVENERKEKARYQEEARSLQQTSDQLRIQISKAAKREEKLAQELEAVKAQLADSQRDCHLQKQHRERLEREQKQREASSRSDSIRLNRQEEQIAKLKLDEQRTREMCKELKDDLIRVRDESLKQLHLKEKQIEQLVNGFQKQMQLIDVLRRQKLHLEAAHVLKYSEEEFLETLDWKPLIENEKADVGTGTNEKIKDTKVSRKSSV